MAKGNPYWGKQRGKLGETVLAVTKGQQVQRAYNSQPANPRTDAQMLQRIKFAAMVAFYKRGQQNLFKYAFETKKQTESDYNAFMRENLKLGIEIYPTRGEVNNGNFPLVAPFMITSGSLQSVTCRTVGVYGVSDIKHGGDDEKNWDAFLAANPQLRSGDIITCVSIATDGGYNDITGEVTPGSKFPTWTIRQIIVGTPLGEKEIGEYLTDNGFTYDETEDETIQIDITDQGYSDANPWGFAFIVSRPSATGLKVSSQQLMLNGEAQKVFEYLSDDGVRALPTWNASGESILEGGAAIQPEKGAPIRTGEFSNAKAGTGARLILVRDISPEIPELNHNVKLKLTGGNSAGTYAFTADPGETLPLTIAGENCSLTVTRSQVILQAPSSVTWTSFAVEVQGKDIRPNA